MRCCAGGHAEQLAKRGRLNTALLASCPLEGDVLRGCTCTNITWPGGDFPKREIMVFGADGQVRQGCRGNGEVGCAGRGEVGVLAVRWAYCVHGDQVRSAAVASVQAPLCTPCLPH